MAQRAQGVTFSPGSVDGRPQVPDPADDEFTGEALDTAGTRFDGATPWAWRNQGAATATLTRQALVLKAPASATVNFRMVEQAAPTAPWRYRVKFSGLSSAGAAYCQIAVNLVNNGTGGLISFMLEGGEYWNAFVVYWSAPDTFGGYVTYGAQNLILRPGSPDSTTLPWPLYVEVENDGTDLIWRVSVSGHDETFFEFGREPIADHVAAVTHIALAVNSENSADVIGAFGWFRRVA